MKRILFLGLLIILSASSNVSAQTINSLSAQTLARSGRLKITGISFGATQGGSVVRVGGAIAHISSWTDGSITAYVAENTPLGGANVQVVTTASSSNQVPLNVISRPPANGRVKWRFQADAAYIQGRAAVGPDGSVYVLDVHGHLYALTPDGGLKWIFNGKWPAYQSVTTGADGVIYSGGGNRISALNPDGSIKWQITDPSGSSVKAGPSVGPDGNIYAVTSDAGSTGGLGAITISPAGLILNQRTGYTHGFGESIKTREIAFGPPNQYYFQLNNINLNSGLQIFQLGGTFVTHSLAGGNQPAVAPNGTIYIGTGSLTNSYAALGVFDPNGSLIIELFGTGTRNLSNPAVGADGVLYISRNLFLVTAINPDWTQKWEFTAAGILGSPTVNSQNNVIVVGGYEIGGDGTVYGISTAGQSLWTVTLPFENNGNVTPMARPKFSTDGTTVYVGTSLASTSPDEYCYLYAIQAGDAIVHRAPYDFDGDGKSDISVFRPANGTWYLDSSTQGFSAIQFGTSSDKLVPADYDGDGKTDVAVYRDGVWYMLQSMAGLRTVTFGLPGDVPQPGDFDGDSKADVAVFRPSNGSWYVQQSQQGFTSISFGQMGDHAVAADYDGDGRCDVAVFRSGSWFVMQSRDGYLARQFGTITDVPLVGDYDGDGKADFAVFRTGTWYVQGSQNGFTTMQFGLSSDRPVPADYDGDGMFDVAVFRDGAWYINRSQAGFFSTQFGLATDTPVPAVVVQ